MSFFAFHFGEVINKFLDNYSIVRGPSVREKTILGRANDSIEERLDSISNDFGYDFVLGVIEANGAEVFQGDCILAFWIKTEHRVAVGGDRAFSSGVGEIGDGGAGVVSGIQGFIEGEDGVFNVPLGV
ncbi:hypothetical protein FXO37_00424 [Capsicum annuum]|nr:hypothetical protein FXO37_00424 [Capsicum annuum]